jgi:2-polyprenyl-6-methoxyphenol hydroxylase-like FAD-dependent oxidoreductase
MRWPWAENERTSLKNDYHDSLLTKLSLFTHNLVYLFVHPRRFWYVLLLKEEHMAMSDVLCDVAIIGYGPTGQMLALLLGERGYRVAVFERWPHLYPKPRGVVHDHEIARLFQRVGIAESLAPLIEPGTDYEWRNASGETLLRFDLAEQSVSGWPDSTMFSQPQLEALLDGKVKALPTVTVYQGWAAEQVEQSQDDVYVQARHQVVTASGHLMPIIEEQLIVRGRYVIEADGANSFLLGHMHTSLTDLGLLFDWLVVDILPHEQRAWKPLNVQVCDPARPTTVVSGGKGRRRWEFMRLPDERVEDLTRAETVWLLLAPWDITPENATLERHALYTFKVRWADAWLDGRLLLAGDAAHLMPPFAGQGLGAGMRDALNLAWKLDLVLSGRAEERLLDTYTSERLPHAQGSIYISVELGKIICISDPEEARLRDQELLVARQQSDQGLPVPTFLPGPGLFLEGDPLAGHLFLQRKVARNGKRGWFDDIVGSGFCLISMDGDPAAHLAPADVAFFISIGGRLVALGSSADEHADQVTDLSGAYAEWFAANTCAVVLTRPDWAIYGSASDLAGAESLVRSLREQMHPSA